MFFNENGPFPDACRDLLRSLRAAGIDHLFLGAVAMKAYGCEHAEDRVEICVRPADVERFRGEFAAHVFPPIPGQSLRFYHPATQIEIDLLVAGEIAGDALRQREIAYPDPRDAVEIAGVPVPPLARLIELKLATWRPADWQAVAALCRANGLDASFAEKLHPLVRSNFVQCCPPRVQPSGKRR
jgi:hypothetical protein